jgi:hypothetical protein
MLWEKLSGFKVTLLVVDANQRYPQENNQFIMQVLIKSGYSGDMLKRLNCVRVLQQLLFMSDILTATGSKIDIEALTRRSEGETRLALRWPNEQPTQLDFQLWKNALQMICLSKSRAMTVGKFISAPHRIWQWAWDEEDSTLHKLRHDGPTEDVFVSGRKPNRFHYSHTQQRKEHNTVCSVESTLKREHFHLTSVASIAILNPAQTTFMEELNSRWNTRLSEHVTITGRVTWVEESIADGTLLVVTDGSYKGTIPECMLGRFGSRMQ